MTLRKPLATAALALQLLVAPAVVLAHAQPEGSYPEHGAVLDQRPARIAVWWDHPMRLTLFELRGPAGVVALSARPGAAPVSRFEAVPTAPMPPGRYTLRWRGIAPDGHVMADDFDFTLR
jgi:methionine-rich copper-binding protein CopC